MAREGGVGCLWGGCKVKVKDSACGCGARGRFCSPHLPVGSVSPTPTGPTPPSEDNAWSPAAVSALILMYNSPDGCPPVRPPRVARFRPPALVLPYLLSACFGRIHERSPRRVPLLQHAPPSRARRSSGDGCPHATPTGSSAPLHARPPGLMGTMVIIRAYGQPGIIRTPVDRRLWGVSVIIGRYLPGVTLVGLGRRLGYGRSICGRSTGTGCRGAAASRARPASPIATPFTG
jgi:hypothetical protein